MYFGKAIKALKAGKRVTRSGWNGKDMYLFLENWKPVSVDSTQLFFAPGVDVRPSICMRDAQGKLVVGWLASQTDMLAEDWEIVK